MNMGKTVLIIISFISLLCIVIFAAQLNAPQANYWGHPDASLEVDNIDEFLVEFELIDLPEERVEVYKIKDLNDRDILSFDLIEQHETLVEEEVDIFDEDLEFSGSTTLVPRSEVDFVGDFLDTKVYLVKEDSVLADIYSNVILFETELGEIDTFYSNDEFLDISGKFYSSDIDILRKIIESFSIKST